MAGQIFILFSTGKLCNSCLYFFWTKRSISKNTDICNKFISFLIKYKITRNFIIYITYTKTGTLALLHSNIMHCNLSMKSKQAF